MSSGPQWNQLYTDQPVLEIETSVRYQGQIKKVQVDSDTCREALIYNIGDWMGDLAGYENENEDPTPWKKKKRAPKVLPPPKDEIELNVESLRQAEGTKLIMYTDDYDDESPKMCMRECCRADLVHTVNSLVSLPGLLLNPDRYTGDWWEQTEEQIIKGMGKRGGYPGNYGDPVFEYWGADNSILQHPALVSITFGLFRQAVILYRSGAVYELPKVVSPREVRTALFNSDEKAALRLVQKLQPWLFRPTMDSYFPLSGAGKWDLFLNLHRALYKHGFSAVFGEVADAWELASRGIKTLSGSHTYFQNRKRVENVNRLANKAA